MKITQGRLKEIILEEVSSMFEVKHDCATHVKEIETGKVGEVISHSLTEDGSVEYYDIEVDGVLKENVPVSQLEVLDMVEHMHSAAKRDDKLKKHKGKYDDGDDKDEKCDYVPCKDQLKEDGHTDVASATRQLATIIEDANDMLETLSAMSEEDSLPSWLSKKINVSSAYLNGARDFLKTDES